MAEQRFYWANAVAEEAASRRRQIGGAVKGASTLIGTLAGFVFDVAHVGGVNSWPAGTAGGGAIGVGVGMAAERLIVGRGSRSE
jgi:hypothetical protein